MLARRSPKGPRASTLGRTEDVYSRSSRNDVADGSGSCPSRLTPEPRAGEAMDVHPWTFTDHEGL